MARTLTSDDLDGLGADVQRARDPRPHARELVSAVDEGRLADPDDAGYALSLAAEARERAGDHDEAVALGSRAVRTASGTVDEHWLHAVHAERLLRLGREDEGMVALAALRPLLHRDPTAVAPIVEALTENGRAELAEQWLTAALLTAVEREERLADGTDAQGEAADVVDELALARRDVRAGLGREPDEYDALADELDAAPDLVFFPRAAYARLLAAQPSLADDHGRDWDEHRALLEQELQAADAEGEVLEVEVATPALVAAMLAGDPDADPDPDADADDPGPGPRLAWPPGRNDPCWCGSGAKYKKCCLPRGRERAAAGPPPPVGPHPPPAPAPTSAPPPSGRVLDRRAGRGPRAR